ncbi:RNA polymerase factor sigma-54 [Guggenheimella bovis]
MKQILEQKPELKQKLALTQNMMLSLDLLSYSTDELEEFLRKEVEMNPHFSRNPIDITNLDLALLEPVDPKEALETELSLLRLSAPLHSLVSYLIHSLDRNGFLKDLDRDPRLRRIEKKELDRAKEILKSLSPPAGAEDVTEALLMQTDDELVRALITDHLESIAYEDYDIIEEALEISEETLQEKLDILRSLQPMPFSENQVLSRPVDVMIKDDFTFELSKLSFPDSEIVELEGRIKEYYDRASFIVKALKKREELMKRILELLLREQRGFFLEGELFLKKLTRKDVAEHLQISESSVTRILKDRSFSYKGDVYPFRVFFPSGVGSAAKPLILYAMSHIIEEEDKAHPLSDEAIKRELQKRNIQVSRRVVGKYRNELGIGNRTERRKKSHVIKRIL